MFNKKTIHDIDLQNKRIIMRAEYDVKFDNSGNVIDDYRIKSSIPTIQYLLEQNCQIIIIAHAGRPEGQKQLSLSLRPVAKRLSELLERDVQFVDECVGDAVRKACQELQPKEILLLENLRFHKEEEDNDVVFAKQLVDDTTAEIFVSECFGVAHRAHASTVGVAQLLPSVAGLNLVQEVSTITEAVNNPKRPLLSIIGGAKISDKIDIISRYIDICDSVAIVGAMANTFLLAQNHKVGKSLVESEAVSKARDLIDKAYQKSQTSPFSFYIPVDYIVSDSIENPSYCRIVELSDMSISDVLSYPKIPTKSWHEVAYDELILDIGPKSASHIAGMARMSATVLWNGTAGVAEFKGNSQNPYPFAHGTRVIIDGMTENTNSTLKPFTLVGGGDTISYVNSIEGLNKMLSYVSSGGGASLEVMAGHQLPAVEALLDK